MEIDNPRPPLVAASPDVMNGMPVFAGTIVPIQTLIDHLVIGDSIDGFVEACPTVSRSQVIEFLLAAADLRAAAGCAGAMTAPEAGQSDPEAEGDLVKPYSHWQPRALPDPRTAPLAEIVKGLIEIVAAEGPVQSYRAYVLYARAMGLQQIREETKGRFNNAMRRAIDAADVVESDENCPTEAAFKFVRAAGAPEIVVRTRGERKIEEIPPTEIAAFMRQFTDDVSALDDEGAEWLFRSVLDSYELVRMTTNTKSVLQAALNLARDASRWV